MVRTPHIHSPTKQQHTKQQTNQNTRKKAVNDGFEETILSNRKAKVYERLLRRLLALRGAPAVLMMSLPAFGVLRGDNAFHATMEDLHGTLAQYYGAHALSYR